MFPLTNQISHDAYKGAYKLFLIRANLVKHLAYFILFGYTTCLRVG